MQSAILNNLLKAKRERRAIAILTRLNGRGQWLLDSDSKAGGELSDEILALATTMFRANRSGRLPGEPEFFVHSLNPTLRLFIVGAVHIAQHLVSIARQLDYDVFVIDPRHAWASEERFPTTRLIDQWPDEALKSLGLDSRSAIVLLSHDPKLDDPALHIALRSNAFYVGALGSRRTHAGRCQRLADDGFSDQEIARIHAPIGLDLGARSPAEIALATMAQIVETLHRDLR